MANTKVWKWSYLRQFGGFWKPVRSGPASFFANRWFGSLLVGIPTWRNIYIHKLSLHIIYVYTIKVQLQAFSWKVVYVLVVPTPNREMTIYIYKYLPYSPTGISKWRLLKGFCNLQLSMIIWDGVMMREAPGSLGQDTSAKLVPCQQHVGPYARGLCRRRFQGWNRPARLR